MRFAQPVALAGVLLAAACSSSSKPAAQPSPSRTSPAPVLSGPAVAPKPVASCRLAGVSALNAATGVTWAGAKASTSGSGCDVAATTTGGTLALSVTPSTTVSLDLQDRKRDLPSRTGRTDLTLSGQAVGAAYTSADKVSFLLYAGQGTRVVDVVLALPSTSAPLDAAGLSRTANGVIAWALAQPFAR